MHKLFLQLTLPLTWRISSPQRIRILQEFSRTELDSAWQSVWALNQIDDTKISKALFFHACEEIYHSDLFKELIKKKYPTVTSTPLFQRDPIIGYEPVEQKKIMKFLVFLMVGEQQIEKDFVAYRRAIPEEDVKKLFEKIQQDEIGHAEHSGKLLHYYSKSTNQKFFWLKVKQKTFLAHVRIKFIVEALGTLVMSLILSLFYLIFAPFFISQARARLGLSSVQNLDLLKKQQQRLHKKLQKTVNQ